MKFSSTVFNRVVTTSALAAAVAVAPLLSAFAQQAQSITGAGSTFVAPLMQRYAREVKKKHPGLTVNYQGIGSSGGIRQTIAGTVDFGASDSAMKDDEIAKVKNGVILVPVAGGAVAVAYNLPGVNNLKLSRKTLPAIFSGQITNWSDPQIKADNPGVNLPNAPIRPVVRADGSGTTFIFTNHLSAISAYFRGRIGANNAPKWTINNALKGKGNPGVADLVRRTQGSVGYVEFSYASDNKIPVAQVQNKPGQFITPSLAAANQALSTVQFPNNFRVFVNDPGQGYPIVGMVWMMVYKKYNNPQKADAVKKFVNWSLTDGQQFNDDEKYTSIPQGVRSRVLNVVNSTVK
jgi:phosphate transport system substrate-binding protein